MKIKTKVKNMMGSMKKLIEKIFHCNEIRKESCGALCFSPASFLAAASGTFILSCTIIFFNFPHKSAIILDETTSSWYTYIIELSPHEAARK